MAHACHDRLLQLALAECFSTFDINNNGYLSLEELADALDTLGLKPTDDEIAWMVSEYAAGTDGTVSEVEFVHMMKQYIDAGDHPQLEYTGKSWCPLNLLSLDLTSCRGVRSTRRSKQQHIVSF